MTVLYVVNNFHWQTGNFITRHLKPVVKSNILNTTPSDRSLTYIVNLTVQGATVGCSKAIPPTPRAPPGVLCPWDQPPVLMILLGMTVTWCFLTVTPVIFQQPWRWVGTLSAIVIWQERSPVHRDAWEFVPISNIFGESRDSECCLCCQLTSLTFRDTVWIPKPFPDFTDLRGWILMLQIIRNPCVLVQELLTGTFYGPGNILHAGNRHVNKSDLMPKMMYWLSWVATGTIKEENVQGKYQRGPAFIFRAERLSWGGNI